MRVYHGSTMVIDRPIAAAGRKRLDFGQGFYVTDIKIQADSWAERMQRIREEPGVVTEWDVRTWSIMMSLRAAWPTTV